MSRTAYSRRSVNKYCNTLSLGIDRAVADYSITDSSTGVFVRY